MRTRSLPYKPKFPLLMKEAMNAYNQNYEQIAEIKLPWKFELNTDITIHVIRDIITTNSTCRLSTVPDALKEIIIRNSRRNKKRE